MGVIAKGEITLNNVNDAYTVSLSNPVCAIHADFDGTNPQLDNAYTDIAIKCGERVVGFNVEVLEELPDTVYSSGAVQADKSWRIRFTKIPSDALEGHVKLRLITDDGYFTVITWRYTVVRESTMLDWIQDWETNKTKLGDSYVITPKLFVGKKVDGVANEDGEFTIKPGSLTGVYIGPDGEFGESAGIYGYKAGKEIFHINETGGLIGGWMIETGGIQTSDGHMKILSEGSIFATTEQGDVIWGLYKDGEAVFANGNVLFHQDGSAEFTGKITSTSGKIGGWIINSSQLYNSHILLDSQYGIAVGRFTAEDMGDDPTVNVGFGTFASRGGVKMYYNSSEDFGLVGYNLAGVGVISGSKVFTLGSENTIAGWNFDKDSIWRGVKVNTVKQYTAESGSITIGSNGLRGYKWFIDSNGDISFMGGKIKFTAADDGGEIAGWKLNSNRFSTNNVALVSDGSVTGLYMTSNANANFNLLASSALENYIDRNGGIYMNIDSSSAEFAAYNINGKKLFKIKSNGVSSIAGWNFDKDVLYVGTAVADIAQFADDGSITLSPNGIFGHKWKLLADGSGKIAGDNIVWDANGKVTFSKDVSLAWETPNEITQKIAFGNMLYRDPEFLKDVANGTCIYLEANYIKFSAGKFRDYASQFGIYYKGSATLLQIDIIDTDGNTTTLWTGRSASPSQSTQLTGAVGQITTGNETIQVKFIGQSGDICFVESTYTESGSTNSIEDYICVYNNGPILGETQETVLGTSRDYWTDEELGRENQRVVQYTCTRWYDSNDLRLGGFHFANQSHKGNEFIVKIIAKIPVEFMIENYHNAYGTGGTTKWITSQNGTGKYETYICVVKCGSDGAFSTINHFALKCASGYIPIQNYSNGIAISDMVAQQSRVYDSIKWSVAFATVYDVSSSDKVTTYIDKNGVYTGTLYAEQIVSGTISTVNIKQKDNLWYLNQDGTGALANGNIAWDKDGNTTFTGKIIAQSGQIAGFKISGTSLTNAGFDNDACIVFRNDQHDVFGAMGGNTLPISSGMRAVARFENNDSTGLWYSRNIALILSAKNGTYNHAFIGEGNGTLNGWIGGYRFDRFTLTTANTIYTDYVNLNKNNRWICKSTVSGSGVALPRLNAVQDALGIGDNTPFCIDLLILSDIGTSNYYIYGRTDRSDSSGNKPWSSDQYPVFVHYNGGRWERQELGAGDYFHVLLVYDPNETQTLDNFSCKYTARLISKET